MNKFSLNISNSSFDIDRQSNIDPLNFVFHLKLFQQLEDTLSDRFDENLHDKRIDDFHNMIHRQFHDKTRRYDTFDLTLADVLHRILNRTR